MGTEDGKPTKVAAGQRWKLTVASEGHQSGEVVTVVDDTVGAVKFDSCKHDYDGRAHGACYLLWDGAFANAVYLGMAETAPVPALPGGWKEEPERQWSCTKYVSDTNWCGTFAKWINVSNGDGRCVDHDPRYESAPRNVSFDDGKCKALMSSGGMCERGRGHNGEHSWKSESCHAIDPSIQSAAKAYRGRIRRRRSTGREPSTEQRGSTARLA